MFKLFGKSVILACFFIIGSGYSQTRVMIRENTNSPTGPIYNLSENSFIRDWIVVGPFPNQPTKETLPDGSSQLGFYKDYLDSIGGESKAILDKNLTIVFKDQYNKRHTIQPWFAKAGDNGIVDFEKIIGKVDHKVAYAFCYIYSDVDQEAIFLFGSDDGAKVWINGKQVHYIDAGRALSLREDQFRTNLNKGFNTILVKISDWVRDWGFAIEAFDTRGFAEVEAELQAMYDFEAFLNCPIVLKYENRWNNFFVPGEFPEMQWEQPYLVEKVLGKFPLKIRWFDNNLNEVGKPEKSGRYAFYAEGESPNGIHVRRAGTMYCMPKYWVAWGERPKAYLEYLPIDNIDKQAWEEHKEAIADYAGRTVLLSILDQEEGAILMSFLDEIKATGVPVKTTDTPIIRDHDYHLALKRKILGVENKWNSLEKPEKILGKPAIILHEGTEKEAEVKSGTADKIRTICQQWYEESGEPFVILVARHGVIIIKEAFGERTDGVVTIETSSEIASITKLLTGLMFAQFVDQGLINIDDPVGKFLPDFPVEGDKSLTLRHCFTHTSGLKGHEEWGGLHNPWLDNVVTNILGELPVGKKHEYNGMGYDLAGKVMEMVSGKSIFRLMQENFFGPLGLKNTILEEDLAFSCHTTAGELAVFGQLLLNKGSYGNLKFFSPKTFEKLLPQPLNKYYPDINAEWGIGITWMRQSHPDAGTNGFPDDYTVLSKNVIGHGSATSSILRIDLDNDLVISQTRRRSGKAYNKYLEKFLMVIESGLN